MKSKETHKLRDRNFNYKKTKKWKGKNDEDKFFSF